MASAAETEIVFSYFNGTEVVPIRTTLEAMGHPQPPNPVQVNNFNAEGFAIEIIEQERSKAIDIRFYWIQERTGQGQFLIYWRAGMNNLHILRCFALSMKRPSQSHRPIATPVFLACPLNRNPLTLCSLLFHIKYKTSFSSSSSNSNPCSSCLLYKSKLSYTILLARLKTLF